MIDPQVAIDKLMTAETADELRDYFQAEGIRGIPKHASACPIADWLIRTTGSYRVGVSSEIRIGENYFAHSDATREFMKMFDDGHYPELER